MTNVEKLFLISGFSDYQCRLERDIYPGNFFLRYHVADSKWDRSPVALSSAACIEGASVLGDIMVADELYIITGYTDMRKLIDGLYAIIEK